jgi:hypothetical protein
LSYNRWLNEWERARRRYGSLYTFVAAIETINLAHLLFLFLSRFPFFWLIRIILSAIVIWLFLSTRFARARQRHWRTWNAQLLQQGQVTGCHPHIFHRRLFF